MMWDLKSGDAAIEGSREYVAFKRANRYRTKEHTITITGDPMMTGAV
jgi:hypothetical protein